MERIEISRIRKKCWNQRSEEGDREKEYGRNGFDNFKEDFNSWGLNYHEGFRENFPNNRTSWRGLD